MFKKGFFLLLLTLSLTACTQERPSTFSSSNEKKDSGQQTSQSTKSSDIQSLMDAIINGEQDKVKELVTEENVNQKDDLGNTPLMVAVQYMDIDIMKELLEKGADPNIKDDLGVSSLAMATEIEDEEIINLLQSYTSK